VTSLRSLSARRAILEVPPTRVGGSRGGSRGVHLTFRAWLDPETVRSSCRCPCAVVAGRLDFPAPSLTLRVAARAFEVFRLHHAGPGFSRIRGSVRTLGSWLPFGACSLSTGRIAPTSFPGIRPEDRGVGPRFASRAAVVGLRPTSPPTLPGVHSRKHRCLPRSRRSLSEITFHPRGFSPPRWFPPPGGRGLVASRCQS
jgi:hypothetical protein